MELKFSAHAQKQLKRRGISKKKVKETVENPDEKVSSFRGRALFRRRFNDDKILEVVTVNDEGSTIIVTGYHIATNEN